VIVVKRDWQGREVLRWAGRILHLDPEEVVVEARFTRPTLTLPYLTLAHGDRMVEHYYTRRWYNVFEIFAGESSHLKGWYCNLARPAQVHGSVIESDDLALDLFVSPHGQTLLLDEDEFEALTIDVGERSQARAALAELKARVRAHQPPFEALSSSASADGKNLLPRS
jgi:predicted RNA-binding protein associated with RNAse of E/G family